MLSIDLKTTSCVFKLYILILATAQKVVLNNQFSYCCFYNCISHGGQRPQVNTWHAGKHVTCKFQILWCIKTHV